MMNDPDMAHVDADLDEDGAPGMGGEAPIELSRDCNAIQIPNGNGVTVRAGTRITLLQALGDTFTVRTAHGYLLRIGADDADAIGQTAPAPLAEPSWLDTDNHEVQDEDLWEVLKSCYDPEIPANIVDLGLIYTCRGKARAEGGYGVDVEMTLTAPGCGMGQVLKDDVERKLMQVPGVREVRVEMVFDPPWDQTMMSESARLQLGMM